ncbi:MAG: hypothetical protein WBF88_07255 [Pusillimonas sp.]
MFQYAGRLRSTNHCHGTLMRTRPAATAKGVTLGAGDLEGLLKTINAATPDASVENKGLIKIATVSQAQALADDVNTLTPKKLADAFQGSNHLLSDGGFQKLPGGLILQWLIWNSNGTDTRVMTFPIAWPDRLICDAVMPSDNSDVRALSLTKTTRTFKTYLANSTGALPSGHTIRWIGLGI